MAESQSSGDANSFRYREPNDPVDPSDGDREALEKVLRETLMQKSSPQVDDRILAALSEVARRYAGAELTLEPITIELVGSVLEARSLLMPKSRIFQRMMIEEIAASFHGSPVSKQRLLGLWDLLQEAVR